MEENNQDNDNFKSQDEQQPAGHKPAEVINQKTNTTKFNTKKILTVFTGIMFLVGLLFTAYFFGKNSGNQVNNNQSVDQQNMNEVQNAADNAPQELITTKTYQIGDDEVTFYNKAEKSENLRLIVSDPSLDEFYGTEAEYNPNDNAEYFKIGKTSDNFDVYYINYSLGLGGSYQFMYINNPKSRTLYASLFESTANTIVWANDLTVDTTSKNEALLAPQNAVINEQKLKLGGYFGGQQIVYRVPDAEPIYISEEKIGEIGEWHFYRAVSTDESNYQILSIIAKFNDLFSATYNLNGELSQNAEKAIAITWNQGDNNSNIYENAGAGCGNSGFMVPKNVAKDQLIQVGSSPQGQKLYQLPAAHPFVVDLYEKDYNKGEFLNDKSLKDLTIEQLTQKHGYFLVENAFGDYLIMLRNDIFIRGGCAKPVVYLYPPVPTVVSVAVGADVTLSEPHYPAAGWQNVLAQPNGELTYKNDTYGSLFWEGYGHGVYPAISEGTVVPTVLALTTIRQQLFDQGLNKQESDDFIEFWAEKLPSKPYVRLTWFDNNQLEDLAPLYVTPKPTTSIRVFLDSEGLDRPISIKPQIFKKQARLGFTLVEWGGLARDGSVPKN